MSKKQEKNEEENEEENVYVDIDETAKVTEYADEDITFIDDEEEEIIIDETKNKQEELYEEKYLKLRAEFDNFRKRSAKEQLNATDRGKMEVFTKLISTIDTLEAALKQEKEEDEFTKGIQMTYTGLMSKLSELGLEEVDYELFDPNYHMAVVTDNNEELEDDAIVEVMQKGYMFDGKLVRQAMVKVNKK